MTPENDKTLRGLFHRSKNDLWNDERDYLEKSVSIDIGQKSKRPISFFILKEIKLKNKYVHDDPNGKDEANYLKNLAKLFPELDACREYAWYDDHYHDDLTCIRCGVELNFFNITKYEVCIKCDKEMDLEKTQFVLE